MTLCTRADADYLRYRVLAWVERKMRVMPQILRLFVYPDQAVPTRTARHKKWLSATLRRFAAFTRPPWWWAVIKAVKGLQLLLPVYFLRQLLFRRYI